VGHCVNTGGPIGHFIAGMPPKSIALSTPLRRLRASERLSVRSSWTARLWGIHLILRGRKMMPEAFASHYSEWAADSRRADRRQHSRSLGVMFCKPPEVEQSSALKSGGATA
jgi:hypothetical protein